MHYRVSKKALALESRCSKENLWLTKTKRFEETKGMDTETFNRLFGKGELGDNKEWIEWDHVVSVASLLKKKLRDLENLKYEC